MYGQSQLLMIVGASLYFSGALSGNTTYSFSPNSRLDMIEYNLMKNGYVSSFKGIAANSLVFGSDVKSADKLANQMSTRGWSESSVYETVGEPYTSRTATNRATGNPATAYFQEDGSYVVVDDVSNEIVQVSNRFDPNWIPDATIVNPYIPKR